MAHLSTGKPIPSWSWQEIQYIYKAYGMQLIELSRVKRVFGLDMVQRGMKDAGYQFVQEAFRTQVDEVDGMLSLLDAEISRRNNLIGVMG